MCSLRSNNNGIYLELNQTCIDNILINKHVFQSSLTFN